MVNGILDRTATPPELDREQLREKYGYDFFKDGIG